MAPFEPKAASDQQRELMDGSSIVKCGPEGPSHGQLQFTCHYQWPASGQPGVKAPAAPLLLTRLGAAQKLGATKSFCPRSSQNSTPDLRSDLRGVSWAEDLLSRTPHVHDALFSREDQFVEVDDLSRVARGPDLDSGTALVRGDESGEIFLLVATPGLPIRHRISSWETFVEFGFDVGKVRVAPFLLIEAVHRGEDILSAAARCAAAR